jgi:hypothetical protein
MTIDDPVYGKAKISEPIILELLETPAILRLKKISQYGIPEEYFYYKGFSRFDHSVGVMLFLRKMNASVKEQIAGLLHDISTTAFSHVADWVFEREKEEDYHELIRTEFIFNTEIPKIIKKNGYHIDEILEEKNFPLLEKSIPDLCADRIDYALRELAIARQERDLGGFLDSFNVFDDEIVFRDQKNAKRFADNFLELQLSHWGSQSTLVLMNGLSCLLKKALELGVISEQDFLTDDEAIMKKINDSNQMLCKISSADDILHNKNKSLGFNNIEYCDKLHHRRVIKKFRYVDPKVIINDALLRLSEIDKEFQDKIKYHQAASLQGFVI